MNGIDTLIPLLTATALGFLLGGLYFGGLWWTVDRMPRARRPVLLYFGSLTFRLALFLVGCFALLSYFDWTGLLACLVGVVIARTVWVHWLGGANATDWSQRDPA